MASLLDLYRSVFGGEEDQAAPMAIQNRQGGFDPYRPAPSPDALQLLQDMTGATDLGQAYNAYQRGEYLPAFGQGAWGAAQAASTALPALKAGGAALKGAAPLAREAMAAMPGLLADETGAIRAWHASPYDFNKFDINKVGSGQGAQSYGHGIYAAESPAVSGKGGQYDLEFTAKNLGKYDLNPGELQIHRMLRADRSDMDILGELARGGGYTFDEALAALERVKGAKAKIYEVDIHADPKAFLDWDRPLKEQSTSVREALRPSYGDVTAQHIGDNPNLGTLYDLLVNRQSVGAFPEDALRGQNLTDLAMAHDPRTGQAMYNNPIQYYSIRADANSPWRPSGVSNYQDALAQVGGDKTRVLRINDRDPVVMSERLREAGIPGIRYLDQGSRGAGEGTSNYAIFDPSIIEILRKYGILPPAVAAGGGLLGAGSEPPG